MDAQNQKPLEFAAQEMVNVQPLQAGGLTRAQSSDLAGRGLGS